MIAVEELRLGNLLIWNPSNAHPASTLSPLVVEVAAILPGQVGYVPANYSMRVEPFEDDHLQKEPVYKNASEFEPLSITPTMLEAFNEQTFLKDLSPGTTENLKFVHQYQNLYFKLPGEEVDTNVLQEALIINNPNSSE